MKRFTIACLLILGFSIPVMAQTGAKQDAEAVFAIFLEAMTNTDIDTVTSLFAEDALFWGTGSQSLVTTPAGVQAYFEPVGRTAPGQNLSRSQYFESRVLNNDLVMVSGVWEVVPQGQDTGTPLRVSMLLALRDEQWKIIQFHNSRVPD